MKKKTLNLFNLYHCSVCEGPQIVYILEMQNGVLYIWIWYDDMKVFLCNFIAGNVWTCRSAAFTCVLMKDWVIKFQNSSFGRLPFLLGKQEERTDRWKDLSDWLFGCFRISLTVFTLQCFYEHNFLYFHEYGIKVIFLALFSLIGVKCLPIFQDY